MGQNVFNILNNETARYDTSKDSQPVGKTSETMSVERVVHIVQLGKVDGEGMTIPPWGGSAPTLEALSLNTTTSPLLTQAILKGVSSVCIYMGLLRWTLNLPPHTALIVDASLLGRG
jgi:hypothetical protein